MNFILFDSAKDYKNLLPLTYTRPISDLRIGILTIAQKWEKYLNVNISYSPMNYLAKKFPMKVENDNILINSVILPDAHVVKEITNLPLNTYLFKNNIIIAVRLDYDSVMNFEKINFNLLNKKEYHYQISYIEHLWDLVELNGQEIESDFFLITKDRNSMPISPTNTIVNPDNIFIEPGAEVECSVLNAKDGFIYIGKDAVIMENSVIRGSLALCEHAQLKVRATIYGPVTIGPYCKVGGEVSESIIMGYSNKAHDGYLGNSVIGYWCNLGAGTNNSNLKNNYDIVKLWNYREKKFISTGLQFCGLFMGDHSKCGINSMFNTGTVIGVSCNIYGAGYPRNFIPSFSWGGAAGFQTYEFDKAIETARRMMARRNIELTPEDIEILRWIFDNRNIYEL